MSSRLIAGRYRLLDAIGEGGQARVYKALDTVLDKPVALKLLPEGLRDEPDAKQRLKRELRLAQSVSHRNVCRLHDLGEEDGVPFISMELIEGQTLLDLLKAVGRLSPAQVLPIVRQLAAGLRAIHDAGIVHRDLKPGNVMLDRNGRAVVMDLGTALPHGGDRITQPGSELGTLAYLAPEQARGAGAEPGSDVYALGVLCFEMLTGQLPPGDGGPVPLALREAASECPPPSRFGGVVPPALDAFVLRCLRREPQARFRSMGELAEAVDELDLGATWSAPASQPALRWPGVPRHPLALRLALVPLAVVALLVAAWVALQPGPPPPRPSLALMPLRYEGPPERSYLGHFLPVALERELGRSDALSVAPVGSSVGFSPQDPAAVVAAGLGVDYVVGGTLRISGDTLQIEATLFDRSRALSTTRTVEVALARPTGAAATLSSWLQQQLGVRSARTAGAPIEDDALAAYVQGRQYLEGWDVARNSERAADAFARAIGVRDDFAEAHAGLAQALWARYRDSGDAGLIPQARAAAERSVALGPGLPESHLALGQVLLGTGRSAEAAESFARALELAPADDALCRLVAAAYRSLGRDEEAGAYFAKAIALRPDYWGNHNALGTALLRGGDNPGAEAAFRDVIRLRPDSEIGYNNLATLYLLSGRAPQAEPLLTAAIDLRPSYRAHSNLGFVYYSTGRFEPAVDQFRRAVALAPQQLEAQGNLGDALRQLGRASEAADAYDRAIGLGRQRLDAAPGAAETRAGLAMYLAGRRRCPEAAAETRRALRDAAGNAIVAYYAAVAFSVCGDSRAATEQLAASLARGGGGDAGTNPDLAALLPAAQRLAGSPGG